MSKGYQGLPCLQSGCNRVATERGRCSEHQLAKPMHININRRENLPKNWRSLRRFVLNRDKFICYICGEYGADGVDHVIPGDDHSTENLKAIHDQNKNSERVSCHKVKTSKEGNAVLEGRKPKPYGEALGSDILDFFKNNKK